MERYIGIDVHLQTCTVAVLDGRGKRLKEQVVETNGKVLREVLEGLGGTKHVVFEEGMCSEWLYELLQPLAEDVAVVQPGQRRAGSKNDSLDAWGLADGLRRGTLERRVFKAGGKLSKLREAVRAHQDAVRAVVRSKNQLRALFTSRALQPGKELYEAKGREGWLKKLPGAIRQHAELVGEQLDGLAQVRKKAEKWLLEEGARISTVGRLETVPGIGPIRAAQIVAIVVSPGRFRNKRTFWSYCGLAVVTESSADWTRGPNGLQRAKERPMTRGLNRNRHPLMKEVFKGAAVTVLERMPRDPICSSYHRQVEAGTRASLARVTLARRIAAVVLALLKSQEVYAPTYFLVDKES